MSGESLPPRRDIWVDVLDLPLLLWLLVRGAGARGSRILAARVSPAAALPAGILARTGRCRLDVPAEVQLGHRDDKGLSPAYRMERLLDRLSNEAADGLDPTRLPPEMAADGECWRQVLRTEFIHKCRDEIAFACAVDALHRRGEGAPEAICVLRPLTLGRFLSRRLNACGELTVRVWSWPTGYGLLTAAWPLPGRPGRWLRRLTGRTPAPGRAVDPEAVRRGVVFQQGINSMFRHYPSTGHYYWIKPSGIDPARVVLYCDRSESPFESVRRPAAERGWGSVDAAEPEGFLDHPLAEAVRSALSLLRMLWTGAGRGVWIWSTLARNRLLYLGYLAMFRRFNVVGLHHASEFPPEVVAQSLALRHAGGIMFWNFWSVMPCLMARYRGVGADLVLAWGAHDRDYYRAVGFRAGGLVEVGSIAADAVDEEVTEEARAVRARLDPKVRFVLAVFDNSYGPTIFNSVDQMQDFYAAVYRWVSAAPDRACVLKPKGTVYDRLPHRDDIQPVERALAQAGRLVRVDGAARPLAAALAADAVACCPLNSAGLTASILAGRRTVHLVLNGLNAAPSSIPDALGRIVFTEVEAFARALDGLEAGEPGIGDHGPFLPLLDAYGDGDGNARAGGIIAAYLAERDQGRPAAEALTRAVADYQTRHPAPNREPETNWPMIRDALLPERQE